jgi:hypothetical protein
LLCGLCIAVFLTVAAWHLDRCLDDDAFISFRYAQNLVRGEGLVYNPGERVEGYTNFLWTLLVAGAMAVGVAPEAASQLLGIAFGAVTLVLLFLLRRERSPYWALAPPALLVAILPYAVECLLGLEMPLFMALVAGAVLAYARERTASAAAVTGALFALATLARPEGAMLAALTFASDLVRVRAEGIPWRRWLTRAAAYLLVFGPYFAWRFAYYGDPLPNTFYAKTGEGLHDLGLAYVGRALLSLGPIALLGLALFWRRRENPRWVPLAALAVAFYLPYLVVIGGDFRHHFRFFIPVLPFLLLLSFEGARRIASAAPARMRVAAAAALVALAAFASWRMFGPARAWAEYRTARNPQLRAVGEYLANLGPPGALLAISGGGIVPYVSGLPAIEMWGLTDHHIARTPVRRIGRGVPGHMKGDGAYVLSRRPRYILFIASMWSARPMGLAEVGHNVAAVSERDLWKDRRFWAEYRLRSAPLPAGGRANYFERVAP